MRATRSVWTLVVAAGLVACGGDAPVPEGGAAVTEGAAETETAAVPEPADLAPSAGDATGPAGEVAPETRAPADPLAALPEGVSEEWLPYFEKIPFLFGSQAGMTEAKKSGKPVMMFYAATW